MSKLCVCIIYLQYHTEWRIWHDTRDTRQLQCHNMTLHTTNLHLQMFSNNKKHQLLIRYFLSCQICGSFRNIRRRPLLAPSPCCKHLPLLITILFRLWLSLWVATSPCARPWTVRTTTTRPTTRTTRAGTATRTTRRPPASRGTPPALCLSPRVSKNINT